MTDGPGISRNGLLLSLPYQLLVDDVTPLLDLRSLMAVRATSKVLKHAVDEELVWRRRITADYRFPLHNSARQRGWKRLYRGLSHPELYTWGEIGNSRLGVDLQWHNREGSLVSAIGLPNWNIITRVRCMPFPLHISWNAPDLYAGKGQVTEGQQYRFERPPNFDWQRTIPNKLIVPRGRIKEHGVQAGVPVELHAGGWSFFALTHLGQILAWGASTGRNESSGTEGTFTVPTLLDLNGARADNLTVGREHVVARLQGDQTILEWSQRWDRPAAHSIGDSILLNRAPGSSVAQVEAGWDFTALLVKVEGSPGEDSICIWKTEWTSLHQQALWFDRATSTSSSTDQVEASWPVDVPFVQLPALAEPIAQIAAGDNFIIALSETGRLYAFELATPPRSNAPDENTATARAEAMRRSMISNFSRWVCLEDFTADRMYEAGWNKDRSRNEWDDRRISHLLETQNTITHISAHFKSFAAYAPEAGRGSKERQEECIGVVLLGSKDRLGTPVMIPELQGIGVIKVTHGDYHAGALTSDGRVLTWGQQSNGALGTWDSISTPENAQSMLSIDQTRTLAGPQFRSGGMIAGAFRTLMRRQATQQPEADRAQESTSERMVSAEKRRYLLRRLVPEHEEPRTVRFGFPCHGEVRDGRRMVEEDDLETKRVFDIAFAGWHSGALAVDKLLTDG